MLVGLRQLRVIIREYTIPPTLIETNNENIIISCRTLTREGGAGCILMTAEELVVQTTPPSTIFVFSETNQL